jgi:radical SAM superfamily enzyme YgiQ (UPF0313 family)
MTKGNVANTTPFVHTRPVAPRALLLAPPVYDFALYDLFLKPYGLCRLGAWLEGAGYRVRLVNALDYNDERSRLRLGSLRRDPRGTGKFFRQIVSTPPVLAGVPRRYARYGILAESLEERLRGPRPDVVLVAGGMTYWYLGVVEAIAMVRSLHPSVPVLLGGVYPTLTPGHARRVSGADEVICGDAGAQLPAVLRRLGLPAPQGVPPEEPEPYPEANWHAGVIRINEGCPLSCRYCASHRIHPRFTAGDYRSALRATRRLHRCFGTRSFAFYDDALLVGREQGLQPYLEALVEEGLRLEFYLPNAVHLSLLDLRTARLMHRAGFREVRLGYESRDPVFHETLGRKVNGTEAAETVDRLREAGFRGGQIVAYVLAGLPGQHHQDATESVRSAAALGIRVQVAEFSPVPGSGLWETCLKRSRLPLEEEPLTHNNSVVPLEWEGFTRADLERLKGLARELSAETGDAR